MQPDEDKIVAIKRWPRPTTVKELRGFLGLLGYYRRFIRNYGKIAQPLTQLLQKDTDFKWNGDIEKALSTLKGALLSTPVLIKSMQKINKN